MKESCETCRFCLDGAGYAGTGVCRRYPPVLLDADAPEFAWPDVIIDDWCGEYQPQKKPDATEE